MFSIFFQFDQKKRKRAVMENKTCANVRPNIHHSKNHADSGAGDVET
jgi:hypothetical protein